MTSGVSPETGLAPLVLVADPDALAHLVAALALAPVVAVDTESNSLAALAQLMPVPQDGPRRSGSVSPAFGR